MDPFASDYKLLTDPETAKYLLVRGVLYGSSIVFGQAENTKGKLVTRIKVTLSKGELERVLEMRENNPQLNHGENR